MKKKHPFIRNLLPTLLIPFAFFAFVIFTQRIFHIASLVPMIFVLAVFLTSLATEGYIWGILSSLISVLAVNYAFTFPYFQFNFSIPVNAFSALVMLCVAGLTGTLTTKIKKQEQMRIETEKERIRANLLRAISHDLRTPLTSIYGSCSTIIENYPQLSDGQKLRLLGEMREDSEWLIRMVENLLSITRVGSGNPALIKTPTALEELIDAVLVKFKKKYPQQAVEVDIPDRFISIPMDAMLIEQVILNVFENAVHHAKGMTKLSLRVFTAGDMATFEIADDGCGVPRGQLDSLFSGYGRSSGAPVDGSSRGMGIGLSVCDAIIKAHGGEIQAESRENHGLTVSFSLKTEESNG